MLSVVFNARLSSLWRSRLIDELPVGSSGERNDGTPPQLELHGNDQQKQTVDFTLTRFESVEITQSYHRIQYCDALTLHISEMWSQTVLSNQIKTTPL